MLLLVNHSLSEPGTSTWTSDLNLEDYTPGQERGVLHSWVSHLQMPSLLETALFKDHQATQSKA